MLFLVLFGVGIYGWTKLGQVCALATEARTTYIGRAGVMLRWIQGLEAEELLMSDSYLAEFILTRRRHMANGYAATLLFGSFDYAAPVNQVLMASAGDALGSHRSIVPGSLVSWLDAYLVYAAAAYPAVLNAEGRPKTEADFYLVLDAVRHSQPWKAWPDRRVAPLRIRAVFSIARGLAVQVRND